MSCAGVANPLEVALQHLTSCQLDAQEQQQQQQEEERLLPWNTWDIKNHKDYQPPLSSATERALHRVSRRYRSAARATCTYLSLEEYSVNGSPPTDIPAGDPRLLPWDFLAAAPALTALSIQQHQVPALLAGPRDVVGSLVGRLRQLQVSCLDRQEDCRGAKSLSWEENVGAVGGLLAQCTGVQALSLCASPLSEEDQQLLATALTAGVTASTPAVVSSSTADVELRSSSGGSNSGPGTTPPAAAAAAAAAAGGGGTGVEAQAVTARLPLLELELTSLPLSACGTWLQQRGHLEQLRALSLVSWERSDFDRSWGWLTSLVGLQELKLEHSGAPHEDSAPDKLPAALTALSSSLTQLSIHKFGLSGSQAEGLATLSALRRLQLVACRGEENLSCKWLTALQQLTFLDLSGSPVEQLPRNLGQALPDLQVLLVANTWCGKLPKGMTRLTRLDAHGSDSLSDASLAAVCEATGLRQLNLSGCSIKYAACLSACSGLEVLELRGSGARGWDGSSDDSDYGSHRWRRRRRRKKRSPRPTLPCLLNLRRLDLSGSDWWVSDLVTMGGLQHLTFLGLSSGLAKEDGVSSAGSLPALGVLPALQQLDLSCVGVDGRQWPAVGAWLGQQPQLTRLSLSLTAQPYCQPDAERQAQGLALLPTQLVELDLSHCGLQRLPPRLSQMTNLRILLAGHNQDLPAQLPAWLPELQQLEALQVHAVDKRVAEVLRQLPRLREFDGTDREVMYELMSDLWRGLPHLRGRLCFGGLFPDPSELDMYWQL